MMERRKPLLLPASRLILLEDINQPWSVGHKGQSNGYMTDGMVDSRRRVVKKLPSILPRSATPPSTAVREDIGKCPREPVIPVYNHLAKSSLCAVGEDVPLANSTCTVMDAVTQLQEPYSVIEATRRSLGSLISTPKLKDKLLRKPPFRFLHDIVMEVTRQTTFAEGLFTEEEKISREFQHGDKDTKKSFLDKAVSVVSFALDEIIDVKVVKIIAGLEVEKTNIWLQKLHQAATTCAGEKSDIAVERILAGERMIPRHKLIKLVVTLVPAEPVADSSVAVTCLNLAGDVVAVITAWPGHRISWLRHTLIKELCLPPQRELSVSGRQLELLTVEGRLLDSDEEPVQQLPGIGRTDCQLTSAQY